MSTLRASDDAEVRARLERALAETRGRAVAVAEISRRPFEYETSFAIDALDVRLADGERLELVVKDVGPAGLSAAGAEVKPAATLEPRREVFVYRELLAPGAISAPRFHGAWLGRGREGWIFLERVPGEVLTDVGEVEAWRQAAAWAGRLDAAARPAGSAGSSLLLRRDAAWHGRRIEAAAAALSAAGGGDEAALAGRLRGDRDRLAARLDALPQAFLHGELYASNVLVERGDGAPRIAPVDWELAGLGPYALDLAALVVGWGEEERLAMVAAFREALPPRLRERGLERVAEDTDLCRLALAVQWIGWSPGWQPPEDHRRDWAAEATELLDRVLPR
ncbi:MAG TPA: aminoglycoside phosphotransferase family protein [Solirubrobacterales bacterium]|nr:aminoglycoside phosphotransferase family protein [Solirubrobacterales bacterium]